MGFFRTGLFIPVDQTSLLLGMAAASLQRKCRMRAVLGPSRSDLHNCSEILLLPLVSSVVDKNLIYLAKGILKNYLKILKKDCIMIKKKKDRNPSNGINHIGIKNIVKRINTNMSKDVEIIDLDDKDSIKVVNSELPDSRDVGKCDDSLCVTIRRHQIEESDVTSISKSGTDNVTATVKNLDDDVIFCGSCNGSDNDSIICCDVENCVKNEHSILNSNELSSQRKSFVFTPCVDKTLTTIQNSNSTASSSTTCNLNTKIVETNVQVNLADDDRNELSKISAILGFNNTNALKENIFTDNSCLTNATNKGSNSQLLNNLGTLNKAISNLDENVINVSDKPQEIIELISDDEDEAIVICGNNNISNKKKKFQMSKNRQDLLRNGFKIDNNGINNNGINNNRSRRNIKGKKKRGKSCKIINIDNPEPNVSKNFLKLSTENSSNSIWCEPSLNYTVDNKMDRRSTLFRDGNVPLIVRNKSVGGELKRKCTESTSNESTPNKRQKMGYIGANVSLPPQIDIKCDVKTGLRPVIIDASNVAFSHARNAHFSWKGVEICVNYFKVRGHKVLAILPNFRKGLVDDKILHIWEKDGTLVFTPSRKVDGKLIVSHDDRYIIQTAAALEGVIVSQDNYRDFLGINQLWDDTITKRLLMFTWVDDMLMFPVDPLGRKGPTLDSFLKFPQSSGTS